MSCDGHEAGACRFAIISRGRDLSKKNPNSTRDRRHAKGSEKPKKSIGHSRFFGSASRETVSARRVGSEWKFLRHTVRQQPRTPGRVRPDEKRRSPDEPRHIPSPPSNGVMPQTGSRNEDTSRRLRPFPLLDRRTGFRQRKEPFSPKGSFLHGRCRNLERMNETMAVPPRSTAVTPRDRAAGTGATSSLQKTLAPMKTRTPASPKRR